MKLIDEALSLAEEVLWAVDQPGRGAAFLLALLWKRHQKVLYVPGLSVDRARQTYMGAIFGAEFLVCVGDICAFESADRLAAYAGLSSRRPVTRANGWVTAAF